MTFPAIMVALNVELSAEGMIVSGNVPLFETSNPSSVAEQVLLRNELMVTLFRLSTVMLPNWGYSVYIRSRAAYTQSEHSAVGGIAVTARRAVTLAPSAKESM